MYESTVFDKLSFKITIPVKHIASLLKIGKSLFYWTKTYINIINLHYILFYFSNLYIILYFNIVKIKT